MFREQLRDKLQTIFQVKKATFDQPAHKIDPTLHTPEQDVLFIEITNARNTIKDTREISEVTGTCTLFAILGKAPFGYFSKCIHQADPALTKDFFFYDIEDTVNNYRDIIERRFNFKFLYSAMYDPNQGDITDVIIEVIE